MELRHLRYFVAVAEELSFTRAAERLHIAQPPLSQQIRQLEEELGAMLVERGARPLRLTVAGELLLERARSILAVSESTREDVQRIGRGQTGHISVVFAGSALYSLLPGILKKFHLRFPEVEVTLNEMLAPEMATAIRDRRADIGFVRPALPESDDLLQKLLLSEPLVLAVPEQHAIAKKKSVPINVVDRERLILYPRHPRPSITNVVLRACDAAGVEPTIVQEVLHVQTAMTLVSAGIGMTFVAHSVTSQERKGLVFVRIEEPAPVADLSLVWRAGVSSPTLRNFLSICDEERSAHRAD